MVRFDYRYYTVGYDEELRCPAWAMYRLDGPITHAGAQPPRPLFRAEPRSRAHVEQRDYTGSHYDRGHMVPSFAMWSRYGESGMMSTYIMTNVIPQLHAVNAGVWEDLENDIAGKSRSGAAVDEGWAGRLRHLTIINGPIFGAHPDHLQAGIAIPSACFSVVYDLVESTGMYRVRAYAVPNAAGTSGVPEDYRVSVRSIEQQTGLDFMPGWGGEAEALEGGIDRASW